MNNKGFISSTHERERDKSLPQYVLPIFPALAILTGQTIGIRFNDPANKEKWIRYIPWSITLALILYFLLGWASSYLAMHRMVPAPGYGQVMLSYHEFAEQWKRNEKVVRVFLRERSLVRFSGEVGGSPRILAKVDEYLLVTNR